MNARASMPMLLSMYQAGTLRLDELVTRRYRLDDINDAIAHLRESSNIRGVICFQLQSPQHDRSTHGGQHRSTCAPRPGYRDLPPGLDARAGTGLAGMWIGGWSTTTPETPTGGYGR